MLALCQTAIATGARFGELAALRWADVDLLNREVHISRTFVAGLGEQPTTKSGEPRTIDLTPQGASCSSGGTRRAVETGSCSSGRTVAISRLGS